MAEHNNRLVFPDGPRSELDVALTNLVDSAQRVLDAQGRLRGLLRATQQVVEQTDLSAVLEKIVEEAVDLVGARYAALGVFSPNGKIERFIRVGDADEAVTNIADASGWHSLLGALVSDDYPIQLENIGESLHSVGVPHVHPGSRSFLRVPIRVRDSVFGSLCLTEHPSGTFTAEDQELLLAFASTAGVVIEHARLLDESRRRQRWSEASAEVSAALGSAESEGSLALIADRMVELAEADLVCVLVPADTESLVVDIARGRGGLETVGLVIPSAGTLAGRAMEGGQPILSDETIPRSSVLDGGPSMVIPLISSGHSHGALVVSRDAGRPQFTLADMEMATDFADKAGLALALSRGRAARARLAILEERSRIARDLHDNVIQRLFAAGLGLQAVESAVQDPETRARIDATVRALDDTIAGIRSAIFTLVEPHPHDQPSLRHRIIDVLGELTPGLASPPRVMISGPIDLMVSPELADDLLAVIREGLANVAKHASARNSVVTIVAAENTITVEVADDGVGVHDRHRASGTANLAARAQKWRGEFSLQNRQSGGTQLRWRGFVGDQEGDAP